VRRLLWFLLAVATAIMFVLIAQQDNGVVRGLSRFDLSSLGVKIVILVFAGALVLALFRERLTQALESALIWTVIAALLAVGYTYRFELREVGDRILAEFVPGHVATRGRVVEVARSSNGNFAINARVNGARVRMVLDTGASSVVLTQEAAKAAGLPLEVLSYTVTVETANGRTRAAPVTLGTISVGGITERAVPALIAQRGTLHSNLLGLSFLNRMESWEVRGDRLILRAYP
jgi:aspartyl protease family protein